MLKGFVDNLLCKIISVIYADKDNMFGCQFDDPQSQCGDMQTYSTALYHQGLNVKMFSDRNEVITII